jgi:hypothetical protein
MRIALWVVALLVVPRPGWSSEWKDGCPAYFPPEKAPRFTPDIMTHAGSAAFGVLPELDSLLGQTRVGYETWRARVSAQDALREPSSVWAGRLVAQANLKSGAMALVSYTGGAENGEGDDDTPFHLANLQSFIGYRHTGYLLGPTFRYGFALRVGGGGPVTARISNDSNADRESLAEGSPLRAQLFATDRPWTVTLEHRIEMVGCHSPFLDLRVEYSQWRPRKTRDPATGMLDNPEPVRDLPIELAAGAYLLRWAALYGAVAVEARSRALVFYRITRTTLGGEVSLADHRFTAGLRMSAITGRNISGIELLATLSWVLAGGSFE